MDSGKTARALAITADMRELARKLDAAGEAAETLIEELEEDREAETDEDEEADVKAFDAAISNLETWKNALETAFNALDEHL